MANFIDRVDLHASGGNGGHGCMSIRREKYKPLGGPDGGNGGHGGSVILQVDPGVGTLLEFHYRPHQQADNGMPGQGDNRHGSDAKDLILPVPEGTIVKTTDGRIIADLHGDGTQFTVARGGIGGRGNAALATRRRIAPGFALLGEPGQTVDVVLELKSMADVALVGFPSCGKSSLVGAISAAQPKVADYPFTTLRPHLGVVEVDQYRYTVADVPGLIPGASQGKGLGLDFLRHIERCSVIVHVVDMATLDNSRDPVSDVEAIEKELSLYQSDMDKLSGYVPMKDRPRVIALNKTDVPDAQELADMVRPDLEKFGWPIVDISAATRHGLRTLTLLLGEIVTRVRASIPDEDEDVILRPEPTGRAARTPIVVTRHTDSEGEYFLVESDNVERWVAQTDFSNDEAIGYLAERMSSAGVEDELAAAGAKAGDRVVIGHNGVIFDYEPDVSTGAELLSSRGSDALVEQMEMEREGRRRRRTNVERRHKYHEMMDAKERARQELQAEKQAGIWTDE